MILLKMCGGLGNQMFQYAYLRRLQKYYKDNEAIIDIELINKLKGKPGGGFEGFVLDKFDISKEIIVVDGRDDKRFEPTFLKKAWLRLLLKFNRHKKTRWIVKILRPFANIFGGVIFHQPEIKAPKPLPSLCRNKYVFGYFDGAKNFQAVNNKVRNELVCHAELNTENEALLKEIKTSESVCLHVRLGDYIKFSNIYDTLCEGYYEKGISYMLDNIPEKHNVKFFVFSNDIEGAKEMLSEVSNTMFVVGNNKGYEDLMLMSACKHFIIANSTFSWWAQYLSDSKDKIVVAPRKWFNGLPYEQILMDNWVTF